MLPIVYWALFPVRSRNNEEVEIRIQEVAIKRFKTESYQKKKKIDFIDVPPFVFASPIVNLRQPRLVNVFQGWVIKSEALVFSFGAHEVDFCGTTLITWLN